MRKTVLALLSAALILAGSAGAVSAGSMQTGGGTAVIVEQSEMARLGSIGSLDVVRWTEVIRFEGSLAGESACTNHGLLDAAKGRLAFVGWCRFTGSIDGSEPGTAAGPSAGKIMFIPFDGHVSFSLRGSSGGLDGLRLVGNVDPVDGTYTVSYRIAG